MVSIPIGVYTYTTIITSAHRQQHYNFKERRSGTTKAANGGRPGPIDAVGRIDVAAAVDEDMGKFARAPRNNGGVEDEGIATRIRHDGRVVLPGPGDRGGPTYA